MGGAMKDVHSDIFNIRQQAGGRLSDRLVENVNKAIATGQLKCGDRLPSIRTMARLCGTSVRIPLAAVCQLKKEGVIEVHPRLGITILGARRKLYYRGQVLIVTNGGDANFYVNALNAEISMALIDAGYRVELAFATPEKYRKNEYGLFSRILCNNYDLIIFPGYDDRFVKMVVESKMPYLIYSSADFVQDGNCVGVIASGRASANRSFIAHCVEVGVRRILQVRFTDWIGPDLANEFKKQSIKVESLEIPLAMSFDRLEVICRNAFTVLSGWLARHRKSLPDLIYFTDDFIARGGLWALTKAGLRIPDDVAIVTNANSGFVPFFIKPVTRIENDTIANAHRVVRQALRYLEKKEKVGLVVLDGRYVRGETF